ncbi:MAG: 5-formyltetrahydrofolate cyclo-ligase [Myxococcales bacterium]
MPSFEASQVAELAEAAKQELRRRMRALRTAHPAPALKIRNSALVTRASALDAFVQARSVALFFPMEDRKEVDLRELDAEARRQGKRVYYPFLEARGEAMVSGLRLTQSLSDLAERGRRFYEPLPDAPEATRGDVDLLFVPALAVAASGHRLGYGAGFYDSLLPDVCPPGVAVAVAYDFQLLAELPTLRHDQPCDWVVTDARSFAATKP